jgi:hypothetical protein
MVFFDFSQLDAGFSQLGFFPARGSYPLTIRRRLARRRVAFVSTLRELNRLSLDRRTAELGKKNSLEK